MWARVSLADVGVTGEEDAGAVVAQPGAAGPRADVTRVGDGQAVRAGPVLGQEQRPAFAPGDEAGQQVRRVGAPGDPHRVAALGGDPGLLVGQAQVLDVERQDRGRAGRSATWTRPWCCRRSPGAAAPQPVVPA